MKRLSETWKRRVKWTGLIVLGATAGLWLFYAVAANLFIGTGLLERLVSGEGEQVLLRYDSAWSWLPGRVRVKGLSLRVQDSNIQFQLGIESATLRVHLLPLARRTFSASDISADGVTFHFRPKFVPSQVNQRRAAAYPPIAGFADPPLKALQEEPPLSDADYNLWTVELQDVKASARDLWFMEWRYLGPSSVSGSFRLKPLRELHIAPTVLRVQGGTCLIGAAQVLSAATGTVSVNVAPFDVRSRVGLDVLQQIDARIDLDAKVAQLQPLGAMYRGDPLALSRGDGQLAVHLGVRAGSLAPQSTLDYRASDVAVQLQPGVLHGDLRAAVRVLAGRLVLGVAVAEATLLRGDVQLGQLRRFAAGMDVNGSDLWRDFHVSSGSFSAAESVIEHLDAMQTFMPQGIVLHGGAADLSGHADIAADALRLRAEAKLRHAHLGLGKVELSASGHVGLSLDPTADRRGSRGEANLDLQGATVRTGQAHSDGLWLKARASGQFLPALDIRVTLSTGPEDALRRLAVGNALLPKVVVDVFGGQAVKARGRVRAAKGRVSVVVASAKDAGMQASGAYRSVQGQGGRGAFTVQVGPLHLALTLRGGEVSVELVSKAAKVSEAHHP